MLSLFSKKTHGVSITASPVFIPDHSEPHSDHFVWAYTIFINNENGAALKLLNRRWDVTDSNGQVQHVEGEGVIGKQPVISDGEQYQYTSGTILPTPSGIMSGAYEMENVNTLERFWVDVPTFSLDSPQQVNRPN